jgi:molybdopterin-guanine dinucleotide biosynthesis protein B
MKSLCDIPVLGFCAYSGTGKTTLLKQVIPLLKKRNLSIGLIKHSHHDFEIDVPGKDSYELRKAGAEQVLIGSRYRWALIHENHIQKEPTLPGLLDVIDHSKLDIILVEGFRNEPALPKIELHRSVSDKPVQFPDDPSIMAIATDYIPTQTFSVPRLDINQPHEIVDFILTNFL